MTRLFFLLALAALSGCTVVYIDTAADVTVDQHKVISTDASGTTVPLM